ncbi:MAG TPA: NAD(P)-dependent alcohol dehydrogenase [Vicinamibacterales bacterium]|nr:NAD(P)-dependent alcohol dehydrogenase [Vicinamibacterales bacterium]
MRAARLHEYGKPLIIDEVPRPTPGPGQVVIRVEGAGFCHSDLHIISGEIQVLPRMPLTLGHENAGTVAAIGGGVTAVKEGDRVAVYGGWGDGFCDYCIAGEENLCPTMQWVGLSQHEGGYAEYLLVPHERYLVPLKTLEPKVAAPLTDAALTPYRAITRALPAIRPDYPVLVIGCGALGQFGVKILRLLTGADIIAVDLDDRKLKTAQEAGATHLINGRDPDVSARIMELARGVGVSAAFDFVGTDSTLKQALASARPAGQVVQIGLAGGTAHLKALESAKPEVSLSVSWWGNTRELREVLSLAESGRLTSIPLEFWPLDKINEVYGRVKQGEVSGRAVITP